MPFATTWIDLRGIMLSEINQRKTNTAWYHLICGILFKSNSQSTELVARA